MSRRAENAFKEAVNVGEKTKESPLFNYLHKPLTWSLLTGIFIFLYLFCSNPPFVQCTRKGDELTRPKPNLSVIIIWSMIGGLIVGVGPWVASKTM